MSTRLRAWLLATAALVMMTAVALFTYRQQLVEALITAQLTRQGIAVQSISVAEVSFNTLLLRNLEIGTEQALQADTILVTWHLRELLAGQVEAIEISGLKAHLELSGRTLPLDTLKPRTSPSDKNARPLRLPAISLQDSAIHVRSPWEQAVIYLQGKIHQAGVDAQMADFTLEVTSPAGQIKSALAATLDYQGNILGKITVSEGKLNLPEAEIATVTGNADFTLTALQPQHIKGEMMLTDIRLPRDGEMERVFEQARLSFQADESNMMLDGDLLSANEMLVAELDATIRNYRAAPDFDLALNTSGPVDQYPWQLLGLAQPTKGSAALTLKTNGQLPSLTLLRHQPLDWLKYLTLTGQARLELRKLRYPQKISHLTGHLGMSIALTKGSGKLDLQGEGKRLTAGPLQGLRASFALPMHFGFTHDTLRFDLRKKGKIKVHKIDPIDSVILKGPIDISLSQLDIQLAKNLQELTLKHQLIANAAPFTLLVRQDEALPIEAQVNPGKITLNGERNVNQPYQGQGLISGASLAVPQSQLALDDFAATLHLETKDSGKIADFSIGRLHHLAPEPHFAPLSLAGSMKSRTVRGQGKVYSLHAAGGVPAKRYLTFTGKHAIDSGTGMLKIAIAPLEFAPGGLQPETLVPALAQLKNVSGVISASAQLNWSKDGVLGSNGTVELGSLSFAHQAAKVSGLNATLDITDLFSPASPPQQILTIRRVDPGIPMESLAVTYQIERTPPQIAIEKGSLYLFGGIASLKPTVINPASARNELVIHVDNIDLEALFNQLQIEGLKGYGRLDGSIPLIFKDDEVIIKNSHLLAEIPGTLHFQSEKASQLLAGTGEEMDLLLQALEDFHYTELSLKLEKSAAHDVKATLSLLGNNPNVQEGQMFRLNINLETNIGNILKAIGQGYKISNDILRELFRFH